MNARPTDAPARTVWLHADAPRKPATGAACNGCGLCCAAEPCPLGMLLSRRRRGACRALHWDAAGGRYVCGALADPGRWLHALPRRWARRLVARWIGAARGCDSLLEPQG
jgi:hypothetical protein